MIQKYIYFSTQESYRDFEVNLLCSTPLLVDTFYVKMMIQEGTTFDHDIYVVVDKQCRTRVTNTISLYKLTNALLSLICFKLVMKSMKVC